jgi:hypothetical protein
MVSTDRMQADAEQAEIHREMAETRLLYAQATRNALVRQLDDAQLDRRRKRKARRDNNATLGPPAPAAVSRSAPSA